MIKVAVNGALGKMGREVTKAVKSANDLQLEKELDVQNDLEAYLSQNKVDVVVDFTRPEKRMEIARTILNNGANGVIGTTGFTPDDLKELDTLCKKTKQGMIIAPNFTIGIVLLMDFAKRAAAYFDHAEIIEYHHNQKADYPSGTAMKTAEMMTETKKDFNPDLKDSVANLEGSRGGTYEGIKIHSVRLPGMSAHQEVIFGGLGQYLTLRHDAVSRESYMPGVLLAIREVVKIQKLIYGLEPLLGL